MRINLDWSMLQVQGLPVFDRAERAKRDLDPLLVVQADVGVNHLNELLDGGAFPVPRIEQFVLGATEEALARHIVRRTGLAGHRVDEISIVHSR